MDATEMEELASRLVDNPHDEDALAYAHQSGEENPKAYASLLEKVGGLTSDPAYAAHWLSEAANVWSSTLGDAHKAARLLMSAIDRDPTHRTAAERLAGLYRDKGDVKALVALLDRRSKALAPLAAGDSEIRNELAGMHEEMGRLWSEAPLLQPRKAIENFRRAAELDPSSAYAIFNARELLKAQGSYEDALPLYAAELLIETNPERRVGLHRDEAETRKLTGDRAGASRALLAALDIDRDDPALKQEYSASIIERIQAGEAVPGDERARGVTFLTTLAETFDGEHGLAYAEAALDIDAGQDKAIRAMVRYSGNGGTSDAHKARLIAYLTANPNGGFASEARAITGLAANAEATATATAAAPGMFQKIAERALERVAAAAPPAARIEARPAGGEEADPLAIFGAEAPRRPSNIPADRLQGVLDAAQMMAGKGKKPEALAKYKEVLELDPANGEALSWVEDYLRSKRDYLQLREVLLASVRNLGTKESIESKKERLREVAGLCEGNLRDVDGAISAWRQLLALDRSDDSARAALTRLLERSQRWDDLANLLEQEATAQTVVDLKVQLEKKLAKLQEDKRKDLIGAAEAWARIARLVPEDEGPVATAAKLFERAERHDLAAALLAEHAPLVEDPVARGGLLERLAQTREQLGEIEGAGDSFAEAADALRQGRLWEEAERLYASAERWEKAANAAMQRGQLTSDAKQQALFTAKAAEYLTRSGDEEGALAELERATNLDPLNDEYADQLSARFEKLDRTDRLVQFLARRGDRLVERTKRIQTRRQAALLAHAKLKDRELVRELWLKVLEDGDDREALERLIDDAIEREDHLEATTLLRRLSQNTADKAEKARIALREAELLADGVRDIDTALSRYEEILSELDPTCRPALQAIAELQENRGEIGAATEALERELKLLADPVERGQIAGRLARLYEAQDDARNAIRALDILRKADSEDFEALTRLCDLCEKTEQWDRVAELLAERIEIEGDEEEAAKMTMKLSSILAEKLDRGDEALAVLTEFADQGDANVRAAYMALGDKLGWKGVVAQKLVDWWFDARHTQERTSALRSAFDRFAEVGRDQDAVRVAIELVRTKGADRDLAQGLERLAVKTTDGEALTLAHEMLAREFSGAERAHELVRQAEVKVRAGISREDAVLHGEEGLANIAPSEAEPLLERLAQIAPKPADVVDLYERQIGRSKAPHDRVRALARAAQVAGSRGQPERARGFYELALSGVPTDDTLVHLEGTAREGDSMQGGDRLRRALANAFAAGGHGARDAGKTRAALLRRAALIAHKELNDADQAFRWLGESLVASVDPATLDELERLGVTVGDPRRTETALSHALGEVFDGPLVRQLLARRARLRRDQLVDNAAAAQDLKKLHDLAPQDHAVLEELAGLLIELSDFKTLVHLYEDQILRGKDLAQRAELARKVARVWEEQLADAREAADAWRRVLRMKAGDEEATLGLERAKTQALKKSVDSNLRDAYAPPAPSVTPAPIPERKGLAERPPVAASKPGSTKSDEVSRSQRPSPLVQSALESAPTSAPTGAGKSAPPPLAAGAVAAGATAVVVAPVITAPVITAAAAPRVAAPQKSNRLEDLLDDEIALSLERLGDPPSLKAPASLNVRPAAVAPGKAAAAPVASPASAKTPAPIAITQSTNVTNEKGDDDLSATGETARPDDVVSIDDDEFEVDELEDIDGAVEEKPKN